MRKIRGVIGRVLDTAWKAELIAENPVDKVDVPSDAPKDDRPRVILTNEQVTALLSARPSGTRGRSRARCRASLADSNVLAVYSRVLGGMRTGPSDVVHQRRVADRR